MERRDSLRDHENFRAWRLSRMGFLGLLLESFSPSPPDQREVDYYIRNYDTDGVPFAVKLQRRATRSPMLWGALTPEPPPR